MDCHRFFSLRYAVIVMGCLCAAAAAVYSPTSRAADDLYAPEAPHAIRGGTLTFGSLVEPPSLDPYHQGADARIRFTVLMYQGLFYESADARAIPLLAESYQVSPDGLAYTIKIRHGVKFHTGTPMTAKDVAYSYNYLRDPKNGSPGARELSSIVSIDAVDDTTVTITLNQPNAALPMILGHRYGGVVPAGYFDQTDAIQRLNRTSVGTGPFKLGEFRANSHMTLMRNPDYWEKNTPHLDRITVLFVPNSASLIVALRNKRVDIALLNRPQDITQVQNVPGLTVQRWPSLSQKAIDLGSESPPLNDVRVRQAIALAVDREEIMRASIGTYGQVIHTMVSGMQQQWGADPATLPHQTVDIEAARKLMQTAGLGNGVNMTLTTINTYEWMDAAAVTLKQQLARIGINLNIQRVDLGVWIKNFQARQMGFTFNDWFAVPDPDLLFYRHFHKAPEGADFRNWNDDAASALLDQGRRETDPVKRKQIYLEVQQRIAETVPTIMLFSADHIIVHNDRIHNYHHHPLGWYFGLARAYVTP